MGWLGNIYRLGVKELISLWRDPALVILVIYAFTYAIYVPASTTGLELRNASIGIADEDRSQLSARIRDALLDPYFLAPETLSVGEIDAALDSGRFTFVLDVPPDFEADVLAGRRPGLQIDVDATAMSQAGIGAAYLDRILQAELLEYVSRGDEDARQQPIQTAVRVEFNPNVYESWYLGVMQLINNITMLAIVLTGAALLREREHGTIEHLLAMPLGPFEIALAKVWSNGLVIVVAASLSLWLVVSRGLGVPIRGSISLFLFGTVLYLFCATAIGIFLSTAVRSMPQFALLLVPVIIPMIVLSGGMTPLESMPDVLRVIMTVVPSTHFVSFATAVLYRGAGFEVVWESLATIAGIGAVFFTAALLRFRSSVALVLS
jgi:ABC-2 type transport system permease protein